jgi:hypothetical protein
MLEHKQPICIICQQEGRADEEDLSLEFYYPICSSCLEAPNALRKIEDTLYAVIEAELNTI